MPGASATQKDVAAYLPLLFGAWDDCHSHVAEVKDILAKQKALTPPQ